MNTKEINDDIPRFDRSNSIGFREALMSKQVEIDFRKIVLISFLEFKYYFFKYLSF